MKVRINCLALLLVLTGNMFAQKYIIPNDLITDFVSTAPANIKNGDAIISSKIDKDNFYEITLEYQDQTKTFKLKPFTFPYFQSKFKDVFAQMLAQIDDTSGAKLVVRTPLNATVDNKIALLFTEIVTYFNTEEERPEVATISLLDNIKVYYNTGETASSKMSVGYLTDGIIEISFYGGFIEKIQVNGKVNGKEISFNNKYSIGISSTRNISQLANYTLYSNEKIDKSVVRDVIIKKINNIPVDAAYFASITKDDVGFNKYINDKNLELFDDSSFDKLKEDVKKEIKSPNQSNAITKSTALKDKALEIFEKNYAGFPDRSSYFINVADVIRYVKKVDVNANDISPVPQLAILDKNQKTTKLFREESSKLFEAIVYTDFFGIFDEASPNGIIQTEINKKFNLNTKRIDITPTAKWFLFFLPPVLMSEGFGILQSFEASFQYSKIEKNNKFLLPETFEVLDDNGNVTSTESYYSPISLYQYRNFSVGGMLNLFTFENQNSKTNMFLDAGFLFGRSGIKETADQEAGQFVNNLEVPIEFKIHILPEKRVSFQVSDKLSWFDTLDSEVNLKSIENNKLVSKNKWLNTYNIGVNVDVSSTGRLFLRYRLTHELDNVNTNFSQLQFGYSFFLLQKNGVKKD